jgi:hypothetical protein
MSVDVRTAVQSAKQRIRDLFSDEHPEDIGLEEVEFDETDDQWLITIGFSRPWDMPGKLADVLRAAPRRRSYKVVRVNNQTGAAVSIKDRELVP